MALDPLPRYKDELCLDASGFGSKEGRTYPELPAGIRITDIYKHMGHLVYSMAVHGLL